MARTHFLGILYSEALTGTTTIEHSAPIWQMLLDPDDGYPCGGAFFIDSLSSPTKGVIIYQDGDTVKVWDIGADTQLSTTAITSSAGAQLHVRYDTDDGKIYWVYNATTAGNVAYTPTAGALYCALFDTGSPSGAITQAALWDSEQCTQLEAII